jgi:hypothetical protein
MAERDYNFYKYFIQKTLFSRNSWTFFLLWKAHNFLQPSAFFQKQRLEFFYPAAKWFWTVKSLS